ncbi:MAG: hypothetical protein LBG64_00350 [Pseudomonadales bacterium]|jgi:hypothetical protein|nr:hypothetical protein [Pseudomonadales bacterium]
MAKVKKLIVTHNAPDQDAIASIWLLQRFDAQHHAGARVAFVNPGETITEEAAAALGATLDECTHVDTGMGEFDHHDAQRASRDICAATLVYDYLVGLRPELANDKALQAVVAHVLDVDHFGEVFWCDAGSSRQMFMLHEIISGMDYTETEDDAYQVSFGCKCFDFIYGNMERLVKAKETIEAKGIPFQIKSGRALAIETRNDETISLAQKEGYQLVIRKDPGNGQVRIKARPDSDFDLRQIYEDIIKADDIGYWFYHPSGKMVLNGSNKAKDKIPTPLTLDEVMDIVRKDLG